MTQRLCRAKVQSLGPDADLCLALVLPGAEMKQTSDFKVYLKLV